MLYVQCNEIMQVSNYSNLKLVVSQRIQHEINTFAVCLSLDHILKLRCPARCKTVICQTWIFLHERLLFKVIAHSDVHFSSNRLCYVYGGLSDTS